MAYGPPWPVIIIWLLIYSLPVLIVLGLLFRALLRMANGRSRFLTPLSVTALLFVTLPLLFSHVRLNWHCWTQAGLTLPARKVETGGIFCAKEDTKAPRACLDLLRIEDGGRYLFKFVEVEGKANVATPGIGQLQRGVYRFVRGPVGGGECWLNQFGRPAALLKYKYRPKAMDPSEPCAVIEAIENPQAEYVFTGVDGMYFKSSVAYGRRLRSRHRGYIDGGVADAIVSPLLRLDYRTVRNRRTDKVVATEVNFAQQHVNHLWSWFNDLFFPVECRSGSRFPKDEDFLKAVFAPSPDSPEVTP